MTRFNTIAATLCVLYRNHTIAMCIVVMIWNQSVNSCVTFCRANVKLNGSPFLGAYKSAQCDVLHETIATTDEQQSTGDVKRQRMPRVNQPIDVCNYRAIRMSSVVYS